MTTTAIEQATSDSVTLELVGALVEKLTPQDQRKLIEQIDERLNEHEETYFARMATFLQMCQNNPIHSSVPMDSGEELQTIREERGNQLC